MYRRVVLFAVFLIAAAIYDGVPAIAQSDWSVTRDPFDRQVVARYKRILARNPGDGRAFRQLLGLYKRHRSAGTLLREYQQQVNKNPSDFAAHIVVARLHLQLGEPSQALTWYRRGAELRPNDVAAHMALGDLEHKHGDANAALAAYQRALKSTNGKKTRAALLRKLATLSLAQDDIDSARDYFEQYFALAPGDTNARVELGDALMQRGQAQAAIQVLNRALASLAKDPARQVELLARIGAAYESVGDENQALASYRRAIARVGKTYYLRRELIERIIDIYRKRQALPELLGEYESAWPKNRRAHFEWDVLARLYEETGDQDEAIAAYRMAVKKAPYELDTQRRLIALLEHTGREDQAISQYETVIRVAPGEARFQIDLAQRYWRRGRQRQALALLAKVSKRFPTDGGVHAAVAELYTRWGQSELALASYTRLTRIEPDDVNHLINLGEQYFLRNETKQALAVWKKIIASKTPESYARLGEVYAEHDMLPEALAMYEKAVKLQPDNPQHYKGRAAVYERQRDFSAAVADWERVHALVGVSPRNANATMKASAVGSIRSGRREARSRVVSLLRRADQRQLRQRMKQWRRAFSQQPPDIEAGYFLVEAQLREQDYAAAERNLERLLEAIALASRTDSPEVPNGQSIHVDANADIEAMELLVKVYKRSLKYERAVAMLERLAERTPARQRDYYNQIAEIKTADRKDEEAIHYARKALAQSPSDPLAHQRLAERYAEMQRFTEAIAAYETAIQLDPRNYKAQFALARLYTYNDAPAQAAQLYRQILRRATDEDIIRRAGQEAINLEEMTGTLAELERVIAPLTFTLGHKPIYRRILVDLYSRHVPELLRKWRTGSPAARQAARAELDRLGTHGLKPLLEALSDDADVNQQRTAVEVLGYLGNKGASAPLVNLAMKPGPTVPSGTRPRISALTQQGPDWEVRIDALVAAGRLGDERIIPQLIRLSRHDERAMRAAALFGLGRTGSRDAISPLKQALTRTDATELTLACLGVAQIGQYVEKPSPAALGDRRIVSSMTAVVGDPARPASARATCAFALGYLYRASAPPSAVTAALIDVLSQGNGDLQRLAAWSLGTIGDRAAIPPLVRALFQRDGDVRRMVGAALAVLSRGSTLETDIADFADYPHRQGIYDEGEAVRHLPGKVARVSPPPTVLIQHSDDIAVGLTEALSRHRDRIVTVLKELDGAEEGIALGPMTAGIARLKGTERRRASQALQRIVRDLYPAIAQLTAHRDATVRSLALSVAAKSGHPDAFGKIITAMGDRRIAVRIAAMKAAIRFSRLHKERRPALARAVADRLGSPSWSERAESAHLLSSFGDLADVAALIAVADDSNAYVREQAVTSLANLIQHQGVKPPIVSALIAASRDEISVIRIAAARGLVAANTPEARARLERMANSDPVTEVAGTVRALLQKTEK